MRRIVAVFCCVMMSVLYWADADVTVSVGLVEGAVESEVVVPVALTTEGESPTILIVSCVYEPDKLAYVGAALGAGVPDGKMLLYNTDVAGEATFLIYGLDDVLIPDGVVLELVFYVASGALDEEIPVLVGDHLSASGADGSVLDVGFEDGGVIITCVPPEPPTGIVASQGRTDGVQVQWDSVGAGVEYRVYRSTNNNESNAAALSGWQTATSFLDTSAAAADMAQQGCSGAAHVSNQYYYWVTSRKDGGCESRFSENAMGYRSGSMNAGIAVLFLAILAVFAAIVRKKPPSNGSKSE